MGIQINGNTNNINAGIGSLSIEDLNELNIVGVATASNFKTGTSNLSSTGLNIFDLDVDGQTNLDHVSVAGVTTFSEDTKFTGALSGRDLQWDKSDNALEFLDYTSAYFGTDNNLQIYHNAGNNNTYISENGTGSLLIQASDLYLNNSAGQNYITCATGGRVQLNFAGSNKLETTNTGAVVTGILTATAFVSTEGQLSNRNKIQNGAMNVSQRFDTDAHTPSSTSRIYTLDRWAYWSNQASKTTIQQVVDAPVGFRFSSKCTVASAYSAGNGDWFGYMTHIEGQDLYDLELGNSNAKAFTLSFYVKSSVAGTWAGAVRNKGASPSQSYPYNYTINSANTWEKKTITIPGPTSGTWTAGRGEGMCVWFDLGTGSGYHGTANQWHPNNKTGPSASPFIANAGATWQITGVQLEKGSVATEYESRSAADEISICERYCEVIYGTNLDESNEAVMGVGHFYQSSRLIASYQFHTQKRVGHNGETQDATIRNTGAYYRGNAADIQGLYSGSGWNNASNVYFRMNRSACRVDLRGLGGSQGDAAEWRVQNNTRIIFSAEFG